MQSFLGILNYYSRLIEDFAIYASVLYELRETDFYEISRDKYVQLFVSDTESDRDRDSRFTRWVRPHSWLKYRG